MTFYSSMSDRNHEMWFLSQEAGVLYYYIQKVNFYSTSPDSVHFKYASINESKSPSITAPIFPVS